MKTILVLGLVAIMGLLAVGIAIPAFAESTDDAGTTSTTQNAWDKMREACQTGDWEVMTEICPGKDFGNMPCLGGISDGSDDGNTQGTGDWQGGRACPMSGGMMGGGQGGNNTTGGSCH